MPTNVDAATPLKDILERSGAAVWFDQTERPDDALLDQGLKSCIAQHDVFLLCASSELFENAGYALQELAWALDLVRSGRWHGTICIALMDDVVLPRILRRFTAADLSRIDVQQWSEIVIDLISHAKRPAIPKGSNDLLPAGLKAGDYSALNLEDLRVRAHDIQIYRVDNGEQCITAMAADSLHTTASGEFIALDGAIKSLRWDGRLSRYHHWPADPVIRDIRLRLGTIRMMALALSVDMTSAGVTEGQLREGGGTQRVDFFNGANHESHLPEHHDRANRLPAQRRRRVPLRRTIAEHGRALDGRP